MLPAPRRFVPVGTAALAGLLAVSLATGLWNKRMVPRFQARLELAIGRHVQLDSLGVGGLRTLVARGVQVFGAPPFDSEPVARAERIVIRLGGPGHRFWEPSEVTVEGLDVEYLSTGAADNLRGRSSAPTPPVAPAGGRRALRETRTALVIRGARVHGAMVLPGGVRVGFRTPDVTLQRTAQGQESTLVRNLVIETGAGATVRVPELVVKSERGTPVSATGHGVGVMIPGGGALVDGASVEAHLDGQSASVELHSGNDASSGLHVSYRMAPEVADFQMEARDLPLRALGVLAEPRGVGLEDAHADLRVLASLDGENLRIPFAIDSQVQGVRICHPAVDRSAWRDVGVEIHASGQATPAAGRIEIDSAEVRAFGAQLDLRGWAELFGSPRGEIKINTPPGAPLTCASLLAAQAQPVRQVLEGLTLRGKLGVSVELSFDAAAWETLALDVRVDPRCIVRSEPQVLANLAPALRQGTPTGLLASGLPLGKYHSDFASLAEMPKHLPAAFLTSEDSHFYAHNGFDVEMIRHALVQDLETRTFGRGASTITQQLAKNLFLTPHRTVARKLEETVLAWRLHHLLPKNRILELYLNVIDLGPGIHGVRQASRTYFGKELQQLRPIESAYLAALTPNPHVLARRFRDGHVDDGWRQRLYDLLAMMRRSGRLSADQLAAARATKLSLQKLDRAAARPGP